MKSFIPDIILPTTVVGSYPAKARFSLSGLWDPFKGAVKDAVLAQKKAGITIISDGQVRGDMIRTFTSKLPGIRGSDVIGEVKPPQVAVTVKDTKYAASVHPYAKAIITGPSTLSYGLHLSSHHYKDRNELIIDVAKALAVEAVSLSKTGAVMLQVDEPIFSTGVADFEVGSRAIGIIANSVKIPICMHVCGPLVDVIDDVLQMPIQIFDFEGSLEPQNIEIFSGRDLKDRYIGFGCTSSSAQVPDSIEEITSRIWKGIEIFGKERLLLDPDCGLRMNEPAIAYKKLERLCIAADLIRKEISV